MMNSNIFLVNLPKNISRVLLPVLEDEYLGNIQSLAFDDINQLFNIAMTNTDYIIFYVKEIDEESIARLELKQDIPTLLITGAFNFEMGVDL